MLVVDNLLIHIRIFDLYPKASGLKLKCFMQDNDTLNLHFKKFILPALYKICWKNTKMYYWRKIMRVRQEYC